MTIRVAVCVSGAYQKMGTPPGTQKLCNAVTRLKFPDADFYFATWEQFRPAFEKDFPGEKCEYFKEPKMHYHPYKDIQREHHTCSRYRKTVKHMNATKERMRWTKHHTKQILIHTWLSDKIKDQYDVIVRVRFDLFLHKGADFTKYIQDTYENNRANCFATTMPFRFPNLLEPKDQNEDNIERNKIFMFDHVTIYPANAIDADHVMRLHEEKRLHPAEYGWYQVIALPSGIEHVNYVGWANPIHTIKGEFRWVP